MAPGVTRAGHPTHRPHRLLVTAGAQALAARQLLVCSLAGEVPQQHCAADSATGQQALQEPSNSIMGLQDGVASLHSHHRALVGGGP
jgi:hypothetical protein